MSRGGTRKARAEQASKRRDRERHVKLAAESRAKAERQPRRKQGRGRAILVHLSAMLAPVSLAFSLVLSGRPSEAEPGTGYWLENLVSDPNASYISEPGGLVYAAFALGLGALVFIFLPLKLWRRLNREVPAVERDRSGVDSGFTLAGVVGVVWLYRVFFGFSDPISGFSFAMVLLSIYVPVFSALLAMLMPIVPGSGRIGGILPNFLRVPVTRRYFLTPEERAEIAAFGLEEDLEGQDLEGQGVEGQDSGTSSDAG